MYVAWLSKKQNSVQHQRWTEGKDNSRFYKETVGKASKRFWNQLKAIVEANDDFFE